jgi:hypothetical protein
LAAARLLLALVVYLPLLRLLPTQVSAGLIDNAGTVLGQEQLP